MTPKEKAEDIWGYYSQYPCTDNEDIKAMSLYTANQLRDNSAMPPAGYTMPYEYWTEVIKELEKQ